MELPTHSQQHVQETLFPTDEIEYWHDYEILETDELREKYVNLTDNLINRIQEERPKHLIFLDKSARPVAWMLKELWPIFAVDDDGEVEQMPSINFIQIDREDWRGLVKNEDSDIIDVDNLPDRLFEDLRSVFTDRVVPTGEAGNEPSKFDNSKIMVVDEIRVSGDTLDIASEMLIRSFPTADVGKSWWMNPGEKIVPGQPSRNADIPVWYDKDKNTGRGVNNRNTTKSNRSPSRRQQRGGLFLSTRLDGPDPESRELREEFKHLASDIITHKLIVRPSFDRDNWSDHFERINGMSFEEYRESNEPNSAQ